MARIYVHGRPQGQDVWSPAPAPEDKFYLNPFLDSQVGAEQKAIMQIDIWQGNSYYSYIHRNNVLEKENRKDAYFAITVSFEKQYCAQTATLYSLLESVYQQICLKSIIEKIGDQERFLVSQLKEQESKLKQLTTIILQNIEKYVEHSLVDIENVKDTTKTSIKTYSIFDVDSPQFLSDCLVNRVLVSNDFQSKDSLPIELRKQIVTLESKNTKLVEEKNAWHSKAESKIEEVEKISAECKRLQDQAQILQKQNESAEKENIKKIDALQRTLSEAQQERDKINIEKQDLKKRNASLLEENDELQQKLKKLSKPSKSINSNADEKRAQESTMQGDVEDNIEEEHKSNQHKSLHLSWSIVLQLFNAILVVVILVLLICKSGSPAYDANNKVDQFTLSKPQNEILSPPKSKLDYSTARIDIINLKTKQLFKGVTYGLQLIDDKKKDVVQGEFEWTLKGIGEDWNLDYDYDKNTFEVLEGDTILIYCYDKATGDLIINRSISVKK